MDLARLNDLLTMYLGENDWVAETEEDYDLLNDLTHTTANFIDNNILGD